MEEKILREFVPFDANKVGPQNAGFYGECSRRRQSSICNGDGIATWMRKGGSGWRCYCDGCKEKIERREKPKAEKRKMLDYALLKHILKTLRSLGLIHERVNQSQEELQKLYELHCKKVGENKVYEAFHSALEEYGVPVTPALLGKHQAAKGAVNNYLTQEEINYALAWQMLHGVKEVNVVRLTWLERENRSVGIGLQRLYLKMDSPDDLRGLLDFLKSSFQEESKKSLGMIALQEVLKRVKGSGKWPAFTEDDIVDELARLYLLGRIELVTTKSGLARAIGIELVRIRGIHYGFMKIVD
jgi:hypothetical protein